MAASMTTILIVNINLHISDFHVSFNNSISHPILQFQLNLYLAFSVFLLKHVHLCKLRRGFIVTF